VNTDALRPQAEVAEDALDHLPVVDERHDTHLVGALRTEQRIGFPDLLDELAPFGRRDAARFVFGNVNDLHGLAGDRSLLHGTLVPLPVRSKYSTEHFTL